MTARLIGVVLLLCCMAAGAARAQQPATPPAAPAVAADAAPAAAPPAVDAAPVADATPAATPPAAADTVPAATAAPAPAPVLPRVQAQPMSEPARSPAGNLLQTIFALLVVLALLGGLAWFLKRYGPKASGGTAHLRTVGALNLGGRERIIVVEVGDQWIVVGASPGRVNALATMPKQHSADAAAIVQPNTPSAGSFSDWLKQTIDKRNAR